MEQFYIQYQNYIIIALTALAGFLLGKVGSFKQIADNIYEESKGLILWIAKALSEADGNGGKPSFTKILGTYVVLQIVGLSKQIVYDGRTDIQIPSEMMTLFMFLIGYQIISKVLLENPALMEIIRGKYGIAQPAKEEKKETV